MSFDSVGLQYLSLQCVLVVLRAPVRTDVTDVERKDEKEFPDHPRIKWSFKNNNSKQGPRGRRRCGEMRRRTDVVRGKEYTIVNIN